jgi:hypothetical protein
MRLWHPRKIHASNKLRLEVTGICFSALARQAIRRGSEVTLYLARRYHRARDMLSYLVHEREFRLHLGPPLVWVAHRTRLLQA